MIVSTTIGGIPVELFLIEPDWNNTFDIDMKIDVDATMGQTGKEVRHPESFHPKFKFTFTPDWTQQDSDDIITKLSTLGTKVIAMPVFADTQSDITDAFTFKGQHYVSWNDAGQWVVDASTYTYVAPLAFGYIDNPTFQGITDVIGKTSITFVEDAPFTHRLSIEPQTVGNDFTLVPESKSVRTTPLSPLERRQLGRGREKAISRQEDKFRYEMDATFKMLDVSEIGYMAFFWYQQRGRLHSFNVPAFFQPAANTPDTPDAYRARFRGESLKLSFKTPSVATCSVGFIQLPWELNDSVFEENTDKFFDDESWWDTFADGNMSVVTGISEMPHRCARIAPHSTVVKQISTPLLTGYASGEIVKASVLVKEDGNLSNNVRIEIVAFNSSDTLITSFSTQNVTPTTSAQVMEVEWTLPANTAKIKVNFGVHTDGTTEGYAYFGDLVVKHLKSGVATLEEEPVQAPECFAFQFDFDVPGKSSIYYVDWEDSVDIGANTHDPYKMTVESMTKGSSLFKEEAVLTYQHSSDNPLLAFVEGGMERLVNIIVYEGNPLRPTTFSPVFYGTLKTLRGKERKLTATFTPFGGLFDKKLPGWNIQAQCNNRFCDVNCKLSISSFKSEATAITSSSLSNGDMRIRCNGLTGTLTNPTDPDSNPGDRFAGGYLEIGSGDNYQIRMIRKTVAHAGTDRSFDLNRPMDGAKLDASDGNIDVYAGCGGTKWECTFYGNYVNFGGFPFVPEKLDTVQGETPKAGK